MNDVEFVRVERLDDTDLDHKGCSSNCTTQPVEIFLRQVLSNHVSLKYMCNLYNLWSLHDHWVRHSILRSMVCP